MTDYRVPSLASFDWQQSVADRVTTPAGGESQGYRYLVIATASGDFTGQENKIATAKQNNPSDPSHWIFDAPAEGWIIWIKDENLFYVYDGSSWGILYQDLKITASPTFVGLTLSGLTTGRLLMGVTGVLTGYPNLSFNFGDERLILYSSAATWCRTFNIYNSTADSYPYMSIGWTDISPAGLLMGYAVPNPAGANYGWISHSGLNPAAGAGLVVMPTGRLGSGTIDPQALLHLDQNSSTTAIPVLTVDQADVSEEFIRFIGTSANGVLTQSLVEAADVSTATLQGYLKIYVQDDGNQLTDQAYYIPLYSLT